MPAGRSSQLRTCLEYGRWRMIDAARGLAYLGAVFGGHGGVTTGRIIFEHLHSHRRYHDADYVRKSSLMVLCVLHRRFHDVDYLQNHL